jgi:hypothetical protein
MANAPHALCGLLKINQLQSAAKKTKKKDSFCEGLWPTTCSFSTSTNLDRNPKPEPYWPMFI